MNNQEIFSRDRHARVVRWGPEADYEVKGFYGNVVFSCGAVTKEDGSVTIYYGASDELTAAATTTIDKIMTTMK